LTFLNI